jgi:hypothetical protein
MAGEFTGFSKRDAGRVAEVTRTVEGWGGVPPHNPRESQLVIPPEVIRIRNQSGETCPPYGCVAITAKYDYDIANRVIALDFEKPSTTFRAMYLFNGPREIANGDIGTAQTGPRYRFLYSGSPAFGDGFGVKPSNWALFENFPTLAIVGGIIDSTELWFEGQFRPITTLLCYSVTAVAAATSYTTSTNVKIYGGTFGSETDCGFTSFPTMRSRTAIAISKFMKATNINGNLELEPLEC